MYKSVFFGLLLAVSLVKSAPDCKQEFRNFGLSDNLNETVAHAIHSMTLNVLREFESTAKVENGVPVVNPRLNDPAETDRVVAHAPEEKMGNDFFGDEMNTIDMILSQIGEATDGLGPNWSPLERIVHKFHMQDLWNKLKLVYDLMKKMFDGSEITDLCTCMKDTKSNGIFDAVDWVADHYKSGTPITLLNRPIPKLTDAKSWSIWRTRLLHYYQSSAFYDASVYLYCALNH